jgi:hypothetical protein
MIKLSCNKFVIFGHIYSTPCLAAIREDGSPDLRVVSRVLEEQLKVSSQFVIADCAPKMLFLCESATSS